MGLYQIKKLHSKRNNSMMRKPAEWGENVYRKYIQYRSRIHKELKKLNTKITI
jgi:hypothetical protein